jgi:hypothetical protein
MRNDMRCLAVNFHLASFIRFVLDVHRLDHFCRKVLASPFNNHDYCHVIVVVCREHALTLFHCKHSDMKERGTELGLRDGRQVGRFASLTVSVPRETQVILN